MNKINVAVLAIFALFSCEADLQVYTDDFESTPIVYCLINPVDSVHAIRLSRSFDARENPDLHKDDTGVLVYEEASVKIKLIGNSGDTIVKYPEKLGICNKEPGFFGMGTHSLYCFNQVMDRKGVSLFKEIQMEIDIPGKPKIYGETDILVRPRIRFPHVNAQYLFVDPLRPLLVQWYGSAWNEVDFQFDIMEQYRDSVVTQSFVFEERTNVMMKEGVCEVHFPYELIVQNMVRILDPGKNVIRRYMGPVLIKVHSGNEDFAYYMDTRDGINDFTGNTISNLENALGFLGCKLSFSFDSLYFDYFTRQRFANDPELKQFKLREY